MSCLLHGGHEELAPLAVVLDVRREASLITHVASVSSVLVLDHGLQRVVALSFWSHITSFFVYSGNQSKNKTKLKHNAESVESKEPCRRVRALGHGNDSSRVTQATDGISPLKK